MIVAFSFPNPIGWAVDKVTGFVGGVATAGFEMIIGGLTAWMIDATVWVVGGVFGFFVDSTDPNVQADWFITGNGPYATTVTIGAGLLVLFLLAGIVQGTLAGDVGGMLRRISLDLPISVLGMVGLVSITQVLIRVTDELSSHVLGNFADNINAFGATVESLSTLTGGVSTAFVVFVLGFVAVLAGLVVVAELVIRAALIYIVVALAPLVLATRLWPATQGAARKLIELLCALILSKLVIAVALSVAAAAAVGTGSGGEVTALPEPEVFAEDPEGSVTQAVGILLMAGAAFGVAAFSPLMVAKLLPLTEAALVGQGIRGGPMRATHQTAAAAHATHIVGHRRINQLAGAKAPGAAVTGVAPAVAATGPVAVAGAALATAAKAPSATAARANRSIDTARSNGTASRNAAPPAANGSSRSTPGRAPTSRPPRRPSDGR